MCDSLGEVRDHEEYGRDRFAEMLIEWLEPLAERARKRTGDNPHLTGSAYQAGKAYAYKEVIEKLNRVVTEEGFRGYRIDRY